MISADLHLSKLKTGRPSRGAQTRHTALSAALFGLGGAGRRGMTAPTSAALHETPSGDGADLIGKPVQLADLLQIDDGAGGGGLPGGEEFGAEEVEWGH